MKTSEKIIVGIVAIVVLALGVVFPHATSQAQPGVVAAASGPDHYNPEYFYNGLLGRMFSQGGPVKSFTATTTQAAYTLTQSDLQTSHVFSINATNSPAFTITLPASSTLTSLVKTPGDEIEYQIYNGQTGAATTTTVVGGTGTALNITTANCAIAALKSGTIRLVRLANTSLYATCATANN